MSHQFFAKRKTSLIGQDIQCKFREPCSCCLFQILRGFIILRKLIQHIHIRRRRHFKLRDRRILKELRSAETVFCDHRILFKRLSENLRRILDDTAVILFGTHRRRGADTTKITIIDSKATLQTAKQASKICSLRSIKSMQLVDCDILQRFGTIILPQHGVLRADQKIVQHLIVRQKDIRRTAQHSFMICDHTMLSHHSCRCLFLTTNIHTSSHIAPKFRAIINELRYTFSLIRCKRVHRIDNQRFDPRLSHMSITVLQNRI